jgi:hypothetical protein
VRVQRGGAVRADDPEVLQAVVVRYTVDVIEDQPESAAPPQLALSAELTNRLLEPSFVEPFLETGARETRVLDEDLRERLAPADTGPTQAGVWVEVIGRDAPQRRILLENQMAAAALTHAKAA